MKYLLLLLVIAFGAWLIVKRSRADAIRQQKQRGDDKPKPPSAQAMLECAHCGLHLPAADAVLDGSRVYCSTEHRLLGPKRAGEG